MNKHVEDKISRIINNLRASTGFTGKFGVPQHLFDRMAFYNTPGVSIAVINDFDIDWAQGFGVRDVRSPTKVTTQTLFQAGSISKAIFALAVMRLVQEGRLDLNEDINRYLSTWKVPANSGWQPKINLRQILSHTAGLTVHGFPGYQSSTSLPTVAQILNGESPANTAKIEVNILPGIQYRYSGGGTTVAQHLLTDLFNRPFPKIMNELLLGPLELCHSTFEQPLSGKWAKHAATAHPYKSIPLKGKFHTYPEMAAAGLWTTPTDLATVGVELLKILNNKKQDGLLSRETIENMFTPQLSDQKVGEGEYAGLGFFCNGKDGSFYFEHGGWDEGFIAYMRFYKNLGKGAVIMINSNEGNRLVNEILRAIAQEYEWPEVIPPEKKPISLTNNNRYTGTYVTNSGMIFQVGITEGDLMLQFAEQPPLKIFPLSETLFFTHALNAEVCFEMDDSGDVAALLFIQKPREIKATKKP